MTAARGGEEGMTVEEVLEEIQDAVNEIDGCGDIRFSGDLTRAKARFDAALSRLHDEVEKLREERDEALRGNWKQEPTDDGGPGKEETYWLRNKLRSSVVHLRDIEDYYRVKGGLPEGFNMLRADRARSLYEQISENFINGRRDIPTMRERAEAAETEVEKQGEALRECREALRYAWELPDGWRPQNEDEEIRHEDWCERIEAIQLDPRVKSASEPVGDERLSQRGLSLRLEGARVRDGEVATTAPVSNVEPRRAIAHGSTANPDAHGGGS